jgi:MoxR-like ATPase
MTQIPEPYTPYQYTKSFSPADEAAVPAKSDGKDFGDRSAPYSYGVDRSGDEIVLGVNVALAVKRPLLLRGAAGCGKSSMARDLARRLARTYYEMPISSRTAARDLQWSFDAVRRLGDAHAGGAAGRELVETPARYVVPGPLWWAFDPATAPKRGSDAPDKVVPKLADPGAKPPGAKSTGAVLLLDEIDKAEPDVPNDLLVPLGAGNFAVTDLDGFPVSVQRPVLIVITTNNERELPPAFLRRCVVLTLARPDVERAIRIARAHFTPEQIGDDDLRAIVRRFDSIAEDADGRGLRPPGTAELLDATRAVITMKVKPGSREWRAVTDSTFWKNPEPLPADGPPAGQ